MTLSWIEPVRTGQNGQVVGYNILCSSYHAGIQFSVRPDTDELIDNQDLRYTLTNILPYTHYKCNLTFINTVGQGPPTKCFFTTAQDSKNNIVYVFFIFFIAPTAPQNFTSTSTKTNVTFSWRIPTSPNGLITHYILSIVTHNTSRNITINVQEPKQEQLQRIISGFSPYQSYNASITASTIIGAGPPATTTGRTEPDSK